MQLTGNRKFEIIEAIDAGYAREVRSAGFRSDEDVVVRFYRYQDRVIRVRENHAEAKVYFYEVLFTELELFDACFPEGVR